MKIWCICLAFLIYNNDLDKEVCDFAIRMSGHFIWDDDDNNNILFLYMWRDKIKLFCSHCGALVPLEALESGPPFAPQLPFLSPSIVIARKYRLLLDLQLQTTEENWDT